MESSVRRRIGLWVVYGLLAAAIVAGLELRMHSAMTTAVNEPIRADARDYFTYALNLVVHGVYSRQIVAPGEVPEPDAVRTPGYPLFLTLFVGPGKTLVETLRHITRSQALISVLVIPLVFLLARRMLPVSLALAAAWLTALSPHLVVMNSYVLTETLFGFLLVLGTLLLIHHGDGRRSMVVALLAAGALLGCASLTRPSLQYLIVPLVALLWWHYRQADGLRKAALLLVGFAVLYLPWVMRNLLVLGGGDPALMVNTLHHGMYPDFMFDGRADTFGFPYLADPDAARIGSSLGTVLGEILRRFTEQPGAHLQWYLLGKPVALWSWNIVAGQGDIFVYPVMMSPYYGVEHFVATRALMHALHAPLMVLAMAAAILAWLPAVARRLPRDGLWTLRVLSLVMLYFTLLHMVGAPFPRYGVPLRPLAYVMSMVPLALLWRWWRVRGAGR